MTILYAGKVSETVLATVFCCAQGIILADCLANWGNGHRALRRSTSICRKHGIDWGRKICFSTKAEHFLVHGIKIHRRQIVFSSLLKWLTRKS